MGIFNKLKNVIDNAIDQSKGQTCAERMEAIEQLKREPVLYKNKIIMEILNNGESFEQVKFGKEVLGEDITEKFLILQDEIVVACLKGKNKNLGSPEEKIVITNLAMYIRPELVGDKKLNRFPLREFGKYILYKSGASLHFVGVDGDIQLSKKSGLTAMLSSNIAEKSFYKLLQMIQQIVIRQGGQAIKDREKLFEWLSSKAIEEVCDGNLKKQTKEFIDSLGREKAYVFLCKILQLNIAIRNYNRNEIISVVEKIAEELKEEDKLEVFRKIKEETEIILSEIKNVEVTYSERYIGHLKIEDFLSHAIELNAGEENIGVKKELSDILGERLFDIGLYLGIRRNPEYSVNLIKESLEEKGRSIDEINSIIKFKSAIQNKRMLPVFNAIKNNENFSDNAIFWKDSFGLTALHYSLIMHNDIATKKIIRYMTKHAKETDSKEYIFGLQEIIDYGTLCFLLEREDLVDSIFEFSQELRPLLRSRKRLSVLLNINEATYHTLQRKCGSLKASIREVRKSSEYSENQLSELQNTLKELTELLEEFRERVREYKTDIYETDEIIKNTKAFMRDQYRQAKERIIRHETLGDEFFYKLFMRPEILYKTLSADPKDCEILFIYGTYFSVYKEKPNESASETKDENAQKEYHCDEESNDMDEEGCFNKPYVDKWFSEAAYRDIKVLRKEYCALVKKYHPANNPKGILAFLDIENERAKILEGFKE